MIFLRGSQIINYSFDGILWETFKVLKDVYEEETWLSANSFVEISNDIGQRALEFIREVPYDKNTLEIIVQPPTTYESFRIFVPTVLYTAWDGGPFDTTYVDWVNRRFTEVWAMSNVTKDLYITSGVKRPIVVLPHTYRPVYEFVAQNRDPSICRFGMAGQWCEHDMGKKNFQKGLECFLKAFPTEQDVRLDIKIPMTSNVVLPSCMDPRVTIIKTDWSHEEMAQWYRSLDVLCNLSQFEGFGLVPLEAMACGTPIMSTNHSGMKDYLVPGMYYQLEYDLHTVTEGIYKGGIWANPKDSSVIGKMREIHGHRIEAKNRGMIASKHVEKFNTETFKRNLCDNLERLRPYLKEKHV